MNYSYPPLPSQPEKSVAERIAEAKKLRGQVSEMKLHFILKSILGSAIDCGDKSLYRIDEDTPEPVRPGVPSIMNIKSVVAEYFHLTREEMLSRHRRKVVVAPRQIAMYIAKKSGHASSEISMRFDGRDPATVLFAVRKISSLIERDGVLARDVEVLTGMLE